MKRRGWIVVAIVLAVFCVLGGAFLVADKETPKTDKEERLADPNLLYFSSHWSGLCSNAAGEKGNCFQENYLYSTGSLMKKMGWNSGSKTDISLTEEKLDGASMKKIKEKMEGSDLETKDCSSLSIVDAGWEYQINSGGLKNYFKNPPSACKEIFDEINEMLLNHP